MRVDSMNSFALNIPEFKNVASMYKVPSVGENLNISSIEVPNFRQDMVSSTNDVELSANPVGQSFEQTLLKAFDMMNKKQTKVEDLTEKMIVSPESVDPHDVTIAMAEASLSLKMTQTIIDKAIKAWNDITTAR